MTTTHAAAVDALETVISVAVVAAGGSFYRDPEADVPASNTGVVIMSDGDAGDPEMILSPLTYVWERAVEFEITANGASRRTVVNAILAASEAAIDTDRTLGGVVDDVRILTAPQIGQYDKKDGVAPELSAVLHITLNYDTADGAV